MNKLPIDVIPNTTPPRFKWTQTVMTPIGLKTQEHEGELHPSVEQAVVDIIALTKRLALEHAAKVAEIERLQKFNAGLADRVNAQKEILERRAERPNTQLPQAQKKR